MRRTGGLVVLGSVALFALWGGDGSRIMWSPADAVVAVVKSPVVATTRSSHAGVCILWPRRGDLRSSPLPIVTGAEVVPGASSSGGPGNLTVAIPPVVLIRAQDHRLVVTTNTGESPQPQDTFYVIAHGTASLARPGLRQRVLSKCAGQSRTGPPAT